MVLKWTVVNDASYLSKYIFIIIPEFCATARNGFPILYLEKSVFVDTLNS